MNRLIIQKMLLEEIRLNTSFTSGRGFYSFPVLVVMVGLLAIFFSDEMIADMGYSGFLESCHIAILFYGVFTGFLAFFGNDFLERIFGYLGLIIGLPSTQPISQRKMTLLYLIKEIIFYSIFTLLPALIGALQCLLGDSALRNRFGSAGRSHVEARLSISRMTERIFLGILVIE